MGKIAAVAPPSSTVARLEYRRGCCHADLAVQRRKLGVRRSRRRATSSELEL
jgi:hypothetical protein